MEKSPKKRSYCYLKSQNHRLLVLIFALMEKAFTIFLLTLLLLLHYVMTQTNITTDQLALLSLKSQIVSDPFHFLNESWSPAISVCRWVGVTCGSHHQRVKSLNLSDMALTGRIPSDFGNLTFLGSLDLGSNNFHGNLPQEMARLRRLKFLDLSFNNFKGEIPSWFGFLHQLQVLNLGNNSFIGSIPCSFSNISTLETLNLNFNSIEGEIPKVIGSLINLKVLSLYGNNLIGSIPLSLSNASRLEMLDLSHNLLQGNIPEGIGNLHNMNSLSIQHNQLMGSIPFTIFNNSRIELIAFTDNSLSGNLPSSFCNGLSILKGLYLSANKLRGHMPTSLSNCSQLQILDLSGNELDGRIHSEIGRLGNLQILYLGSNHFTGIIPQELGNLVNLAALGMEDNQINGSIPINIFNSSSLQLFGLWRNNLEGYLPREIGNLTKMQNLDLRENAFIEIGNLKAVTLMDLTMNQFSNGIPREIGGLQNLVHLSLRHNLFQGSIPDSMSNMVGLEFLDISHNNISGTIPMSMVKLHNLKVFNVSVNKLYGEIPSGGPFKNLSSQFFIDNEALCGSSRFSVPPCPTSSKHISNSKKMLVLFLVLGIALIFVPITFVFVWIRYIRGRSAPQQVDSLSTVTRQRISYYELLQATDSLSQSNLIGSGSFGSVYKGVLRSGTAIAVKVFNLQLEAAFKSFDTECEVLRSLRHRNLVKVITSCSNLDFKALVLEYMPNGSLEKWLYSHNYFLDIMQRLTIMIYVACALEYLHHGCSSPVIHCDIKPSNVLLDEDMVAHLSDFGIAKLLGEDESDLYTKTLATFGYIAPEYGLDGLVSVKCDVYSYGIMLLETFTRRKPNEFKGDLSLKQWVSYSLPEAAMDVVDANLVTPLDNCLQKKLDVVSSIMKVALDCCAESPARRSNMKDVVGILQKIKLQLLAC
ncbi:probable LRR receptor-like serine/threonine-protein kinase At3g47570 isoform X2 [Solanum dulcamara]|uniref:probable LRR receptor-like serine/threonine-protein kinase At3g47570 isoform X2 n=1 Tax=Solanum dulcamara TaxID=45834 RepID=UPI002484DE6F|nr:probable LRR receptor-like serine/threonine-protein kinase At3g47570 isoform X2 [Solanum dulcamara]